MCLCIYIHMPEMSKMQSRGHGKCSRLFVLQSIQRQAPSLEHVYIHERPGVPDRAKWLSTAAALLFGWRPECQTGGPRVEAMIKAHGVLGCTSGHQTAYALVYVYIYIYTKCILISMLKYYLLLLLFNILGICLISFGFV